MSVNLKDLILNRGTNPNAQFTVGNMVAFADAAGTSPVDGTGGSPTVTIARTLSAPLDGTASFLFTKDAANRQGEGFSTDITLQASDATKMLTLSFDYQITTGTYTGYQAPPSFSDLTVWIYDVTNAVMYQAMGYQIDASVSTTNQYSYQGQWQVPVACLTARVIWFLGNTTANAFTARINNVSFGRQPRVQGSVEAPWTAYTPTGAWSANTTYTAYWRRTGDTLDLQIKVATSGAPTSASLTVNLPSGMTIDTAKITDTTAAVAAWNSMAVARDASTESYECLVVYNNTTSIAIMKDDGDGTFSAVTQAAPFTFGSGDFVSISVSGIPILGWGANGTLGQDADTRVIAAMYARVAAGGTCPTGSQIYSFDAQVYDTLGMAQNLGAAVGTSGTFGFRIPVAGYYSLAFSTIWNDNATDGNIFRTQWIQNGVIKNYGPRYVHPSSSAPASYQSIGYLSCNAGDLIQLLLNNDIISSATGGTNPLTVWAQIQRISGPAQVQAPETPTASYNTNAGQAIANAATPIIDFEDIIWDTFGSVTTGASWKFNASRSGKLQVDAAISYASAVFTAGSNIQLFVYKNGSAYKKIAEVLIQAAVSITDIISLNGSCMVAVNAGDFVDIRTLHGESTSRSLTTTSNENYVDISYKDGF